MKRDKNFYISILVIICGLMCIGMGLIFRALGLLFQADVSLVAGIILVGGGGSVLREFTKPSSMAPFIVSDEFFKRISEAQPGDIQEIAASQIQLLSSYYQLALEQQRKSFKWALFWAGIGLACFLAAGTFLFYRDLKSVALISTISGTTVQIISGIQFYLYAQTTKQLADFHLRLDITQRFLLANSVCESLTGETKEKARHELVQAIAGIKADKETKQDEK